MAIPVNSVLPAITGTVTVGQTLSLSSGTWTDSPTYTYAWLRSGVAIAGATASTYIITRSDIGNPLVGRVTATNIDGSASADSLATVSVPTTLITEDGTGKTDSDSYATLIYALDYHDKTGNAAWAALTDTVREQCLRKATIYMEGEFRARWKGYKNTSTQALAWPRAFVYIEPFYQGAVGAYPFLVASNIVPVEVKNACCELALKASTSTLLSDTSQQKLSVQVGPISTTYDKFDRKTKKYEAVEAMLSTYIENSNSLTSTVKRA